ncbi:MAG: 50S ribosomal protein L23 [Pirellulales bacterium]|nr:50S ribosomal protein L23 [Pirellulales bacterium]
MADTTPADTTPADTTPADTTPEKTKPVATKPEKTKSKQKQGQAGATSLHLEPHQILLRPLVTEKGMHRSSRFNAYSFEINRLANKEDVRRAVEELFDVKVVNVRTQNRKGKPRRSRFRYGYTKDWKKAIVTLDPEYRIDFF